MKALLALLMALAVAASGTALAQNPSLLHQKRSDFGYDDRRDPDLVRKATFDFARCALERRKGTAMAYLATMPSSEQSQKYLNRLVDSDCVGAGMMKFSEPLFRGAMYQNLYLDRFGSAAAPDLAPLASPDYAQDEASLDGAEQQAVAMRQFGDCVVRDQPETTHRLATSVLGSGAENGAFASLMPSFSKCLPKDKTLSFKKSQLRGTIAEVLYRIRMNAVPAPQTPQREG